MSAELNQVPGFLFFDHVAISVKPGELEAHVQAYQALGFQEVHREDVLGGDQVREVLLQVGDGPNLVQLLEPLTPESPVAKQIEKNGGRGGMAHVALRVADIQQGVRLPEGERLQDHRQGAAQRLARHHGFLRASQDHRDRRLRLPARSGAGGRACLKLAAGTEILNLSARLPAGSHRRLGKPPLPKDLKGADYEKKLVWRTEEGLAVRPYYRREALAGSKPSCEPLPASIPSCAALDAAGRSRRTPGPAPTPSAPTCCTKPARTRCRNLGYAHRGGSRAAGRR